MLHPICNRHLTRRDECSNPREQPERDQHSRADLDHSGSNEQSRQRMDREWNREAEELGQAVLKEEQPRDDPKKRKRQQVGYDSSSAVSIVGFGAVGATQRAVMSKVEQEKFGKI